MEYAIQTSGLCKKYSGKFAVDHAEMHVPVGSIYGFVGENGSGKTTIMRLIMGLASPTQGDYALFGVGSKDSKIYSVRNKISAIVEAPSLVPSMNAMDNLKYAMMYYGAKKSDDELRHILETVGLQNTGGKNVKNFSLGMKQRLGIAVLLLNQPELLLLDEPMNGLDPHGIAELRELIIDLNRQGITILISSHILSELEKVATHWGFISHGQILQEISSEQLQNTCKKHIELKYPDYVKVRDALVKIGIKDFSYNELGQVKIYQSGINITDMLVGLRNLGVEIEDIRTNDFDIEQYYLSLIRGERSER